MPDWVAAASKGNVAYCGFDGGVGAMANDGSVRKAGGERPKALGEKALGRERWLGSWDWVVVWARWSEADWMGKMEERDGEGWGCWWKWRVGESGLVGWCWCWWCCCCCCLLGC